MNLLPRALLASLTLEAYLALVQLATLGVGLATAFAVLRDPPKALPLVPRARSLAVTGLLAPAVFSLATTVAFLVARPTLLAELMAGGQEAVQKSTGQFGRELVQSPALLALAWGAIISPVAEELFFRGALWSLIHGVLSRTREGPLPGLATTLAVGGFFGALHWDMPGGLGLVRFVSALCLGLACGFARQATRSVTGPILLHVLFNALSLATVRRWVVFDALPRKYGTPTLVTLIATVLAIGAVWMFAASRKARRPEPE